VEKTGTILAGLPDVFGNGREQVRQQARREGRAHKHIGQLKVELDSLKKKSWPHRLKSGANGSIHDIRI
jgi:hypothetical protein